MEKHSILLCLSFSASLAARPQSAPLNYRETVTLLDRMTDDEYIDAVYYHTDINARRSRTYYDGMGKPVEETCDATGLSGKATITYVEYDGQGRVARKWLRQPAPDGLQHIPSSAVGATAAAFFGDKYAYSQNTYDALGRLASTTPAGAEWHGKGKAVTVSYGTNAENEVKWYKAPMEKVSLVPGGYYPAGTLSCETTTDEDGRKVSVYKDFIGNKVLERRGQTNDTYYVYNDMGQLRYVLSPEYQKSGYKNQYAYEYRYDAKGRVVKKILPGCEYTQYWYDDADRVAFMQDATLRGKSLYRFFVYDLFGRMAMQGTCGSCNRQEHAATAVYRKAADGFLWTGYELTQPESIGEARLETVNYYDDYDFLRLGGNYAGALCDSLRLEGHESAKGYKTGCLEYTSGGSAMLEAFYLDLRGNIVGSRRAWGGRRLTATDVEYTFTDELKSRSVREYALTSAGLVRTAWHTLENVYGKRNGALEATRLTLTDANGNQRTQTIKTYTYDDAGRLQTVARGGSAGTVSYAYNLKGWPTRIDSNEFHEELHYTDGIGTPCYSGDISSMLWRASDYPETRGYKFTYDTLDRLTEAVYGEGGGLSDKQNRYNEKVIEYTANGAMKRFQRRGRKDNGEYGKIDNLNIKLRGNQLLSVTDDALPANKYSSFNFVDGANENTEYEYNGVGALTKDLNRGLTIEYDNLNNPQFMQFSDGNTILYDYSSDGTLLRKIYGAHKAEPLNAQSAIDGEEESNNISSSITSPTLIYVGTTEYSGDIIYKDGKLNKVLFPGGYCTFDHETQEPQFHYFTQDHLGNNRAVVSESGEVEQITHYYPFGGTFGDAGLNPALQQYKYNGKLLDRVAGLNTYDFGARQYSPLVPWWDRMDKMCEKYYKVSPYVYCQNSPINYLDNDGNWGVKYIDEQNKTICIAANFYCVSKAINGIEQFTEQEVSMLNEFALNNYSDIGIVSKGKYEGYKMTVKLNFILGDDYISTKIRAEDDVIEEARVGNLISKSTVEMNRNLKRTVYDYGSFSETGGIADAPTGEIIMNENYCSKKNIVHEAYHDLGLTHPKGGGNNGVMHYPPQKVSQEEIDKLSEHSKYLYEIFK